jgi:hypothetical protein
VFQIRGVRREQESSLRIPQLDLEFKSSNGLGVETKMFVLNASIQFEPQSDDVTKGINSNSCAKGEQLSRRAALCKPLDCFDRQPTKENGNCLSNFDATGERATGQSEDALIRICTEQQTMRNDGKATNIATWEVLKRKEHATDTRKAHTS